MKKITLLLVSIISIGLATVSCSKKDSETSIEGKWIFSKEGISQNGQDVFTDYVHTATCEKDYISFTGSNFKSVNFEKLNGACKEYSGSGTFTRNGDELKVISSGVTNTIKILNLSDSELKTSNVRNEITYIDIFTKG